MKRWFNVALVCKESNKGLHKYMNIRYGNVNTWNSRVPLSIHKWKCRYNTPMTTNMYDCVTYPRAFEDPASTLIVLDTIYPHDEFVQNKPFITDFSEEAMRRALKLDKKRRRRRRRHRG
jgi:hypothetical protein